MQTPAFRSFLKETGKIVHHLNTIAVGLAAVEVGTATKPEGLDVSWNPDDVKSSSRQARAFALRATMVMLAEEVVAFVDSTAKSPACKSSAGASTPDRAERFKALTDHFGLPNDELFFGPLLVIHWRNRIIHRNSKAGLTKDQRTNLCAQSSVLYNDYKHLDPELLLQHFDTNSPSLKDTSSLVALSINFARRVQDQIREPISREEVIQWIRHFGIEETLDRVKRIGRAKGKELDCVSKLLRSTEPALEKAFLRYCTEA